MNWIRLKSPPIAWASVLIAIVLARPGHALHEEVAAGEQGDDHPLEQVVLADDDLLDLVQQPLHRHGVGAGGLGPGIVVHGSLLGLLVRGQAGAAAGDVDGHGEADADEHVLLGGVDERGDDADDPAVAVQQRPARVAGVHGGVDLDQAA